MVAVRRAVQAGSSVSIRRVGVEQGFALVMTTSRESDMETDLWSIYNLALNTGKIRKLVSGYRVRTLYWVGPASPELAIVYYDCWDCEAATLFTTIHFTKGAGWSARWPNRKSDTNYPQPGAVVSYGDAGEPYSDDVADQMFAIIPQPDGSFAAGSWFHSRNLKTGKVIDDVERYIIDSVTRIDRVEGLKGDSALKWEEEICSQSSTPFGPNVGQSSKSCKRILKERAINDAPPK